MGRPRPKLNEFAEAYAECALWSSNDESDESGGRPLDDSYSIDDIATPTLRQMVKDCNAFYKANRRDIRAAGMSLEQAGHDFWLTRNGHGAGFWDRGNSPALQRLTKACEPYGSFDLYVGDDGRIYGS